MTDKYTPKEIKSAWERVGERENWQGDFDINDVISELTKPVHEFREGEVAINKASGAPMLVAWPEDMHEPKSYRPLRLSEMPKAVEDLRETIDDIGSDAFYKGDPHNPDNAAAYYRGLVYEMSEKAQKALAAFDEVIEP